MTGTSHDWILAFTALTETSHVTNLNVARALRAAGMYAKPARGNGHLKTRVNAYEVGNFILAQAASQASDAAEVVTRLRELVPLGVRSPTFGKGTFGDVVDRMIGGVSADSEFAGKQLPHEIHLTTNPYRAVLIWHREGSLPYIETYAAPQAKARNLGSFSLVKMTYIHSSLIELAWRMLAEPTAGTKNAALAGATLHIDQPTAADTTDQSGSNRSDDTSVVCAPTIPRHTSETEDQSCPSKKLLHA
jgi:hypothetical protein